MKILFINLPYYGHVVPTIGLVQELTKLGCEVKSNDVNELTELCISLVQNESRYNSLANAVKTCRLQNASECIYSTLKEA